MYLLMKIKCAASGTEIFDLNNYSVKKIPGYDTLKKMVETGEGLEAVVSFKKQSTFFPRLDVLRIV